MDAARGGHHARGSHRALPGRAHTAQSPRVCVAPVIASHRGRSSALVVTPTPGARVHGFDTFSKETRMKRSRLLSTFVLPMVLLAACGGGSDATEDTTAGGGGATTGGSGGAAAGAAGKGGSAGQAGKAGSGGTAGTAGASGAGQAGAAGQSGTAGQSGAAGQSAVQPSQASLHSRGI